MSENTGLIEIGNSHPPLSSAEKVDKLLERPDIYSFHACREFLKVWFEFLRQSEPGFSLRAVAKKAGISTGYLPMFLKGSISLSANALGRMLPFLGLSSPERSYLKILRNLNESEDPAERMESLKRMQKFKEYQELNPKEVEVYQYLSHWYYVAIREMTALPEFKLDPKWIHERLRFTITLKEVEEALAWLMSHGLIQESTIGRPAGENQHLDCDGGVYKVVLGNFHREMLSLAKESIQIPRKERAILGHTLAIAKDQMPLVKNIIRDAIEKIIDLGAQAKRPDDVYQIEFSMFPLTQGKPDQQDDGDGEVA